MDSKPVEGLKKIDRYENRAIEKAQSRWQEVNGTLSQGSRKCGILRHHSGRDDKDWQFLFEFQVLPAWFNLPGPGKKKERERERKVGFVLKAWYNKQQQVGPRSRVRREGFN